jgi:CO/xanthine dehydrogenase Mo-binding subunit
MFALSREGVSFTNPDTTPELAREYRDPGLRSVRGPDVVTGKLQYAGDTMAGKCSYGAFFTPAEFNHAHRFQAADLRAALAVPGVLTAGNHPRKGPFVVAESYPSLERAMATIDHGILVRKEKKLVRTLGEVREHARLVDTKEDRGDVVEALDSCEITMAETYTTHHYNVAFIEPQSSVAMVDDDGARIWDSTQHAHRQRLQIAKALGLDEERVRVRGTNVGGGFGGKISHGCAEEAALMSRETGLPIKRIYSRAEVFQRYSRAKEEVAVDLVSGVTREGRIVARAVDIYQDEGFGLTDVYDTPNSRVRLHRVRPDDMAIRHATIRGTSYTQDVFALESHISSLARFIGMDPLELRLKNVRWHGDLLQAAADMIDYGGYRAPEGHGLGMAIINHGGRQLGALFVEVGVDRRTGRIDIRRMRAAFDIGVVMCESTAAAGIYGALMWGISIALKERIDFDRHRILTNSFAGYEIARFSDVPDMEFRFIKTHGRGVTPRGCGEMPLPLVAPAIANAVFDAVGVRLYSTPFTPEKVLQALDGTSNPNE